VRNFVSEVRYQANKYTLLGGKTNRRMQAKRMISFAKFAMKIGCKNKACLGNRYVVEYYKSLEHLSENTLYQHHRALVALFELLELPKPPPRPRVRESELIPFFLANRGVAAGAKRPKPK